MSFEAVAGVTRAEAAAKAAVAAAEAKAKQMLNDARNDGKAVVSAALAKAEGELAQLQVVSAEKTAADEKRLEQELAAQKEALRAEAESKIDKAAALIVERIVKS